MQLGVISMVNFFLSGTTIEISCTRIKDSSVAGAVSLLTAVFAVLFFGCSGNVLSSFLFFAPFSDVEASDSDLKLLTYFDISLKSSI